MPTNDGVAPVSLPLKTPDGTAYMETGAGDPIVFVHGVGMNRGVWAPQLSFFSSRYRTVAYDMLGHGESRLPPETTELGHLSDQLVALLDHLGIERAHLVGHSMGALVVLDLALRQPKRVKRLTALNAVYQRSPAQRSAVVNRAQQLRAGVVDRTIEATISRWLMPGQSALDREAVNRVRTWLQTADRTGYARIYSLFATADDAFAGRLGNLSMPALFATGEFDPNSTPSMSRQMAAEASEGHALVVDGKRHMMAYFAADFINPYIFNFLTGTGIYAGGVDYG